MNEPKTEKGRESLERIFREAEKLFAQKGYYATSIKDIMANANLGTGTFYIYFEDKLSLYKQLLTTYSHVIRRNIALKVEGATSRKEAEKLGILAFLETVAETPSMYNVIWESLYIDKQLFDDYYQNFAKSYMKQLEKARYNDEIQKDLDIELVSYMLIGISNFVGLRYAIFEDNTERFAEIAEQIVQILDGGLFKNKEDF